MPTISSCITALGGYHDIDEAKLNELMGRMLGDLERRGHCRAGSPGRFTAGLYKALAKGPLTPGRCSPRQLASLSATRANGCPPKRRPTMSPTTSRTAHLAYRPSRQWCLPTRTAPAFLMGGFDTIAALMENQPKVQAAFKTGGGVQWGDQAGCMFCAVARFFRPGYRTNLVDQWLPAALDGVVGKLGAGGTVADVGCGHGLSTVMMAQAFPKSQFTGFDFHEGSIAEARQHAKQHGVTNVRFEVAKAKEFPGDGYDLVTFFDCLHDMGDPVGAAAHVRQALGSQTAVG